MRPAGADHYVKWRRSIDEHLELRRLTWDEYAMFNWLCTKASPRTGAVRTSWPTLAEQTGLSSNHVEQLCRSLKRKRYVWYPNHRGRRVGLVEVAIHKYPVAGDSYTDLRARFADVSAEVPAEVPTEVLAEVPAELPLERRVKSDTSDAGRQRHRQRQRQREETHRVRSADPTGPPESLNGPEPAASLHPAEALARVPAGLRETLDLYCNRTGRTTVTAIDLAWLTRLGAAHAPAVIQTAIAAAVERVVRRGHAPATLTLAAVWASLQPGTTPTGADPSRAATPPSGYPPGVTRLW